MEEPLSTLSKFQISLLAGVILLNDPRGEVTLGSLFCTLWGCHFVSKCIINLIIWVLMIPQWSGKWSPKPCSSWVLFYVSELSDGSLKIINHKVWEGRDHFTPFPLLFLILIFFSRFWDICLCLTLKDF